MFFFCFDLKENIMTVSQDFTPWIVSQILVYLLTHNKSQAHYQKKIIGITNLVTHMVRDTTENQLDRIKPIQQKYLFSAQNKHLFILTF